MRLERLRALIEEYNAYVMTYGEFLELLKNRK